MEWIIQIKELLNLKTVIPKNIEPLIKLKLKKYSIIDKIRFR